MAEQDGKIDTLQCLHEGLRRETIDRHPSFPIPGLPANATSLLLHQSIPPSMSSPESPLPPLIDLSMERMAPTPPKFQDASAIEGLLFEYNQVIHPDDSDVSGQIVDPGAANLYRNEHDVLGDLFVKVGASRHWFSLRASHK